jgi:hypothetical protein
MRRRCRHDQPPQTCHLPHGLMRIRHQIHHHLMQLMRIRPQPGTSSANAHITSHYRPAMDTPIRRGEHEHGNEPGPFRTADTSPVYGPLAAPNGSFHQLQRALAMLPEPR